MNQTISEWIESQITNKEKQEFIKSVAQAIHELTEYSFESEQKIGSIETTVTAVPPSMDITEHFVYVTAKDGRRITIPIYKETNNEQD